MHVIDPDTVNATRNMMASEQVEVPNVIDPDTVKRYKKYDVSQRVKLPNVIDPDTVKRYKCMHDPHSVKCYKCMHGLTNACMTLILSNATRNMMASQRVKLPNVIDPDTVKHYKTFFLKNYYV